MRSQIYPPLTLRVFVDDITALLMVKKKVVAEMAKKVTKRPRIVHTHSLVARTFFCT